MPDEQVTFGADKQGKGGIPIPLTMETLVNVLVISNRQYWDERDTDEFYRKRRRYLAIRDRILRMYRKRDEQAAKSFELWTTERGIANDLRRQLKEKDKQIAELKELLELERSATRGAIKIKNQRIAELEDTFYQSWKMNSFKRRKGVE